MAIRAIEAESFLRGDQLDTLLAYYSEWELPDRYVICFTAFAIIGSYQAQFQERNEKFTEADTAFTVRRVMRELGPLFIGNTPVPACAAFDQIEIKARILHRLYCLWVLEMHQGDNSVMSRVARGDGVTERDIILNELWWQAREKFWPKRDAAQLHEAMRYALHALKLDDQSAQREAMLTRMRHVLLAKGGLFFNREGELQLGARDARDILSKELQLPRRRPDRDRKRRSAKVSLVGEPDDADESVGAVGDLLASKESADAIRQWQRAELRKAKPGSNRRFLLLYMGRNPGQRPPVVDLAGQHGRDKGGMSRALRSLVLDLKAHLSRGSSS